MAKEVYKETYKKGAMQVNGRRLPFLRHIPKDFVVESCEIRAAGKLDDGREFQDLRIYVKQGVIASL